MTCILCSFVGDSIDSLKSIGTVFSNRGDVSSFRELEEVVRVMPSTVIAARV